MSEVIEQPNSEEGILTISENEFLKRRLESKLSGPLESLDMDRDKWELLKKEEKANPRFYAVYLHEIVGRLLRDRRVVREEVVEDLKDLLEKDNKVFDDQLFGEAWKDVQAMISGY